MKVAYSIGETLIKPAALAMVKAVCGEETTKKLTTIPLSNDSVHRRIVELSNDVKEQIVTKLKESKFFSLQLDEAIDVARVLQLLAYIRVASNNDIEEHFLFCQPLSTTKTGKDMFNMVDKFFTENLIDWAKCLTVCTDGAPSMIGCRKGFVAHVKKVNPSVQVIHCMLHRKNLASRELSETLHGVMKDVIEIVNFVKARGLNSRLFEELCSACGASHRELLFHSETRWLSRGKVLSRVVELKGELETFLLEKHFALGQKFQNKESVLLLCYLCDMMTALNTLNESMQGHGHTMIDFADKVRAFKEKLQLWYVKVESKRLASFPILNRSIEDLDPEPDLITSVSSVILEHLHTLRKNFEKYIPENINNYMWIKNPFTANVADFDVGFVSGFQEQLIGLKNDSSLQLSFRELSLPKFWCQVANEYPILYEDALKIIIPFPSSYLCEMGFSAMAFMKDKYRNRLDAEHPMRLALSDVEPRFQKLVDAKWR